MQAGAYEMEDRRVRIVGDPLESINQIISGLPNLARLVLKTDVGKKMYKVDKQDSYAVGTNILSEPGIAIMRFRMKKGESLEAHKHNEKEWILVISGEFETFIRNIPQKIAVGQCVAYPAGAVHYGTVLEDLDCICISIPRAEGYPE